MKIYREHPLKSIALASTRLANPLLRKPNLMMFETFKYLITGRSKKLIPTSKNRIEENRSQLIGIGGKKLYVRESYDDYPRRGIEQKRVSLYTHNTKQSDALFRHMPGECIIFAHTIANRFPFIEEENDGNNNRLDWKERLSLCFRVLKEHFWRENTILNLKATNRSKS